MQIMYLNVNGFSGALKKNNYNKNNEETAKSVLTEIFNKSSAPDILFLSEFDANSKAGKYVIDHLPKNYFPIFPNGYKDTDISRGNYTSIVIAFVKYQKSSQISPEKSPENWLKWNEIIINGYRIVGVHIPSSKHEPERARNFWKCFSNHHKKYMDDKVLYIGDMNVFEEGSEGKKYLKSILETARDGWLETGHTNDTKFDFTHNSKTRIDYAILSKKFPFILKMDNYQEFYSNKLSDHSAILIEF